MKTQVFSKKHNRNIDSGTLDELFNGWVLEEVLITGRYYIPGVDQAVWGMEDYNYEDDASYVGNKVVVKLIENYDTGIRSAYVNERGNPVIDAGEPFEITDADLEDSFWNYDGYMDGEISPEIEHYAVYEYVGNGRFKPVEYEQSFMSKDEADAKR